MSFTIANGKYQLKKLIGRGSYGKVYCSHPFAIKQMHLNENYKLIDNQLKVLNLLISNKNQNIVKLHDVFYENGFIYVVMEKCDSDFSDETIKYVGKQEHCNFIIRQIINGYRQLELLNIVHRDLKPSNLLLKKGVIKIADFGLSKCRDNIQADLYQTAVGTPKYMAPQIFLKQKYSSKCDVWSLGIMYYQLLFGCFPWRGRTQKALIQNIIKQKLLFPSNNRISNQAHYILSRMLQINQTNRADWNEVYSYFIDLPLQKKLITQQDLRNYMALQLQYLGFDKEKLIPLLNGNSMELQKEDKKVLFKFFKKINPQDKQILLNILKFRFFE